MMLDRWQALVYIAALVGGGVLGLALPGGSEAFAGAVTPLLVVVLYVTFLGVPFESFRRALVDIRFMIAVLVVNFVVVPGVAWALARFVAGDEGLLIGVLLVLLAPCVDYVIVFTRLAGGADERLLAATPLLLAVQLALLPVYLLLFAGWEVADAIEPGPFLEAFLWLIVVPLALAVITRLAAQRLPWLKAAKRVTMKLTIPAMALALVAVAAAYIDAIRDNSGDLLLVALVFAVFLAVMPLLGSMVARIFGLSPRRARAVVMSGSTRNSLVVLPLALVLAQSWSVVPAVVVTQTLIELIGMAFLVKAVPELVADRQSRHSRD